MVQKYYATLPTWRWRSVTAYPLQNYIMSYKLDYWYLENCLSKSDIKDLNNFIKNNYDKKEPKWFGASKIDGTSLKNVDVTLISLGKIKDKIRPIIEHLQTIAQEQFGYLLFEPKDGDLINQNTYSSKDKSKYDYHCDESMSDLFDVKLTLIINISQKNYKGGEFYYFKNGEEHHIEKLNKPGNVIIFKSHLNHKVTPIISGERITLSHFMCGPKFR